MSVPNVILLDRDGVINRDLPTSVLSREQFEMLAPSPAAIALLNRKGYRIAVVTNQACVGRGELSGDELDRIHQMMREQVAEAGGHIDAIYVCPHTDDDRCDCRKPRTGLIDRARDELGFVPEHTWMVGDDLRDVEAARAAGCRPAVVHSGKLRADQTPADVASYRDLMDFARSVADTTLDG